MVRAPIGAHGRTWAHIGAHRMTLTTYALCKVSKSWEDMQLPCTYKLRVRCVGRPSSMYSKTLRPARFPIRNRSLGHIPQRRLFPPLGVPLNVSSCVHFVHRGYWNFPSLPLM
jgi:hypothetical protein